MTIAKLLLIAAGFGNAGCFVDDMSDCSVDGTCEDERDTDFEEYNDLAATFEGNRTKSGSVDADGPIWEVDLTKVLPQAE